MCHPGHLSKAGLAWLWLALGNSHVFSSEAGCRELQAKGNHPTQQVVPRQPQKMQNWYEIDPACCITAAPELTQLWQPQLAQTPAPPRALNNRPASRTPPTATPLTLRT